MTFVQTHTYVLHHPHLDTGEPVIFYVGEATDPAARFKKHQRDAADPLTTKAAYCYLRDHNITTFSFEVIPNTTEAQLVEELTLAGVTLYNANRGVASATKKKRTESVFSVLNRQAEEALERSERRTTLHGPSQTYSRSELVRQRITDDMPSMEEALAAQWVPCVGELVGGRPALSCDRGEHVRLGDYHFIAAYRKKECAVLLRHTDGRVSTSGRSWHKSKEAALFSIYYQFEHPAGFGGWDWKTQ